MNHKSALAIFTLCVSFAASGGALAQDVRNGEMIAKTWCAGCHVVNGDAPSMGRMDAVPSFSAIAQMSSTTNASLRVFLSTPHANMPDYSLTQKEMTDVSAYILSLRH